MMNSKITSDKDLARAIHGLPGSISPRHDLWPGIAARIRAAGQARGGAGESTAWRGQALAASVAIAFVAGLMFGRQMGPENLPVPETATPDIAMLAVLAASEREYQAAFREFIPVGVGSTMLEPQAVENIQGSWSELQQAETALLAALRDHPENNYLNQKLLDLRSQQLRFMKQLATLDQFSRRKI